MGSENIIFVFVSLCLVSDMYDKNDEDSHQPRKLNLSYYST